MVWAGGTAPSDEMLMRYPEPVRTTYRAVLEEVDPARRHRRLLVLAERVLRVAGTYRMSGAGDASDAVLQEWRTANMTLGRLVDSALPNRSLDGGTADRSEQRHLPHATNLRRHIRACENYVEVEARNLVAFLKRAPEGVKTVRSEIDGWRDIVTYRNRSEGHPDNHSWPVDHDGYYETFTPLLEAAVTELALSDFLQNLFSSFAVGTGKGMRMTTAGTAAVILLDVLGVPRIWLESPWQESQVDMRSSGHLLFGIRGTRIEPVGKLVEARGTSLWSRSDDSTGAMTRPSGAREIVGDSLVERSEARTDPQAPSTGARAISSAVQPWPTSELNVSDSAAKASVDRVRVEPGELTITLRRGTQPYVLELTRTLDVAVAPCTIREYASCKGIETFESRNEQHPVANVSWFEVIDYCNVLSASSGLNQVYTQNGTSVSMNIDGDGFRLPTEREWEYLCFAGAETELGEMELANRAWYQRNSQGSAQPVGLKEPNPFGLFDMLGNVREWCWDWYGETFPDDNGRELGPDKGVEKVVRGGSFLDLRQGVTATFRDRAHPKSRMKNVGFRLVRTLKS